MSDAKSNERMRTARGRVSDTRPLVSFLYQLARDHLAVGVVEELLDETKKSPGTPPQEVLFTNGWLAQWAKDAADRLGVPE